MNEWAKLPQIDLSVTTGSFPTDSCGYVKAGDSICNRCTLLKTNIDSLAPTIPQKDFETAPIKQQRRRYKPNFKL